MSGDTYRFERLKGKLRLFGFSRVDLETTDQSTGYGFNVTALFRGDRMLTPEEMEPVVDYLEEMNLLDIDWNGPVGEDEYGYAHINLKETP